MLRQTNKVDPRHFQVAFQLMFLAYGLLFLNWSADWVHYLVSIGGCIFFNWCFESVRRKQGLPLSGAFGWRLWGFSALISGASLCLLLKTEHWWVSLLATFFTVVSKYLFRFHGKHLFNPSAFGIVAVSLITSKAWLSPGQWGSGALIFFFALTLGFIVVTRVQKLDVSLAFLVCFGLLLYWRQVYVLGWPTDYFFHSMATGSLLLFSFFMISDPKTAPNHAAARIIWAVIIAAVSFYLAAFRWKYNTPVWVLVAAAPLVPLLDRLFQAKPFQWMATPVLTSSVSSPKRIIMKPLLKKLTTLFLLLVMVANEAFAFCGFYVSKADGTLKNKTSQVILVRDGDRNVITMYNDFKGNFKDFAMVIPVPVVLKRKEIKVVDQQIFTTLNEYSKPRLVEYYDENPCNNRVYDRKDMAPSASLNEVVITGYGIKKRKELGVKIEAKYLVGEYDILILSAKQSNGLKTWLDENGYKIPPGAEEVLAPYIKSNLKFFVVKVNEQEKKKLAGNFLRPIQISFFSPKFMLPIRLGMANADGDQDMLVYAFTKRGRIECTNYRTVAAPTGKNIPLFVQSNFGSFYSNLFQHQWAQEGKSIAMLEYAWDVSPKNYVKCDPCVATAPSAQDLVQAGVWWLTRDWSNYSDVEDEEFDYSSDVHFTRLHVRYNRNSFPQDLQFQVTPNKENFQARYIITHPADGDFDCAAGKKYLKDLKQRRRAELETLANLTGKGYDDWDVVKSKEEESLPKDLAYAKLASIKNTGWKGEKLLLAAIGILGLVSLVRPPKKERK